MWLWGGECSSVPSGGRAMVSLEPWEELSHRLWGHFVPDPGVCSHSEGSVVAAWKFLVIFFNKRPHSFNLRGSWSPSGWGMEAGGARGGARAPSPLLPSRYFCPDLSPAVSRQSAQAASRSPTPSPRQIPL